MSTIFKDISYDLIEGIFTVLDGLVIYSGVTYPVYKSVPKVAPDNYIFIGGVVQIEAGTKESFIYEGTVMVKVVTDNLTRADRKLAQNILNVVRGLLKPTKSTLFSVGANTLVVFSHESMTEIVEQGESITKVSLSDIYNFTIQ